MAHDLDKFPLLSYVLHQRDYSLHAPPSVAVQETLLPSFPLLSDPQIMSSLAQSIPTTITETLFIYGIYNAIGSRPDPFAVSSARSKIAQIKDSLSPEEATKELEIYAEVVRFDEVHQRYEKKLKDLEEKLRRSYATVESLLRSGDEVNEEVVAVLKAVDSGRIVKRIDLSGLELKLVPEVFGNIVGLVYLNLSRNDLTFVPNAISKLKKLEELDISSNSLESLPNSIGMLLNLRILNVNANNLTELPESMVHCRSLVELDASCNNLASLPTYIGYGLQNLEKLSIQLNKLCYFPNSISEMRNLKYLDAHMNEIHEIPNSIGRLTKLEFLNLSSNNLMDVPDTITDLTNLRELDLSNNQIQALPDSFYRLRKLKKLNLDQNPLEIPSQEVAIQGAEAVREFMRKRWGKMAEEQQRNGVEAERHGEIGWVSWGSSMVTNLISGVSQTIGFGGGSGDGADN